MTKSKQVTKIEKEDQIDVQLEHDFKISSTLQERVRTPVRNKRVLEDVGAALRKHAKNVLKDRAANRRRTQSIFLDHN